jgi:PKD repeat protein
VHTYDTPGSYTVTLTATNSIGSDSETIPGMIQVIESTYCDTTSVPDAGDLTLSDCYGVLTDDGGPFADYSPGESGAVTIAPAGAEWVTLTFMEFAFETNFDVLRIFDGPDIFSPLIGEFTGNGVGILPNGGVITSTGPAITVQQGASPGPTTWEGFIANWNCSFTGIAETDDGFANAWPQPSDGPLFVATMHPAGNGDQLLLHDPLGKLVGELPLTTGSSLFTFDLSGHAPGCYSLTLLNDRGRWTRTIVLN